MISSHPVRVSCFALVIGLAGVGPALAVPAAMPGTTLARSQPAPAADFPLVFKGAEVTITRHATRADLAATLGKLLGTPTPMDDPRRLQYDVQFDPAEAPMAVVFDWGTAGTLVGVALDASSAAQNPPAKALRQWLLKNAGPGRTTRGTDGVAATTWDYRGWRFTFRNGGDGEDAVYGFTIAPVTRDKATTAPK